jgi:GNAT superfamily N-acetyltransferase
MHIRSLTPADLPFALSLSRQAGWNQLEADWRRALDLQPDGCFLAEYDDHPAGTTTTCILGDVAWIAMVLVEQSLRGKGIGAALMKHALAFLEDRGISSVWLDATPLGEPVYRKLGFVEETLFVRHRAVDAAAAHAVHPNVRPLEERDWARLLALDRSVYAYDRERLLRRTHAECPGGSLVHANGETIRGFAFLRTGFGFNAVQIGALVATTEDVGMSLVHGALARSRDLFPGKPRFIDVPKEDASAVKCVESSGFEVQRPLLRMRKGTPRPVDYSRIWASSGPEKG